MLFLLLFVFAVGCKSSCDENKNPTDPVEAVSIDLLDTDISLYIGETFEITPVYNGEKTVAYTSSNESVIDVSQQGFVTAKQEGVAFVDVSDGEVSVACKVTVLKTENYISLSAYDADSVVNSKKSIVATIYQKGQVVDGTVTFSVSSADLVYEANGNEITVSSAKVGYYTIKATYGDLTAECSIKIVNSSAQFLTQPSISVENCATAKWAAVDNADAYKYMVNGGAWTETTATEFSIAEETKALKANEKIVITVKALAKNNFNYIDSLTDNVAFGHTYVSEMVAEYSCVKEGTIKYTCSVCAQNYTVENYTVPHKIKDGECTVCGLIVTDQILYKYDAEKQCYYVAGPDAGFGSEEVYFLSKYNDGKNGEHPVSYVGYSAFKNNSTIKRVIMPSSITELRGLTFDACKNLEFVSMVGVSYLPAIDQPTFKHDNFRDCPSLTQIIVGDNFDNAGRNFMVWQYTPSDYVPQVDVYVYGTTCKQLYTDYYSIRTDKGQNNNLLTGNCYFYDENSTDCFKWHFAEDGENIVTAGAHSFVDGVCKKCGAFDNHGVTYEYDASSECYYVGNNQLVTEQEVEVLAEYNDGTNGVHPVSYVSYKAFFNNTKIKKVVLPDSVKQLDGMVFQGCTNLEYVSMTGVADMKYANITRPYKDGQFTTNNNFLSCIKLTTLIVNKKFNLYPDANAQQFLANIRDKDGNLVETPACVKVYVNGTETESTVNALPNAKNDLLTGEIYYVGDLNRCQQWKLVYGEIEASAASHTYVNKKCTVCNAYETKGVLYGYDATAGCYYVSGYAGTETEVNVLSLYDDGMANGEKAVGYVARKAFFNNTKITKVTLPDSVKQLDGMVFQGCSNLEYVSMTGIEDMTYAQIERPYQEGQFDTGNNFLGCVKLTTLIVGTKFNLTPVSNAQQFLANVRDKDGNLLPATPCVKVYVDGTLAESNVNVAPNEKNDLLTGEIYYKGDLTGCMQWKVNQAGEIETTAAGHTYEDATCTNCGIAQTAGINYGYYDGSYFVLSYTGSAKEVYVPSKYNDGTNGEKAVTRVARKAFWNNTNITKVILPSTVKQLDGMVFQGCSNLEYVSMTGVETMQFVNLVNQEIYAEGNEWGLVGEATNNNFHLCTKLTTLVVGTKFSLGGNQQAPIGEATATIDLYVDGANDSTFNANFGSSNGLFTQTVYYRSDSEQAGSWHYVEGVATLW